MAAAILTSKGRITIPKEVREKLNIDSGDRVELVEVGKGVFTLIAATRDVKELKGIISSSTKPVSIGDMSRAIRKAWRTKRQIKRPA
jgi:antitoxin PrlF